MKSFLRKIAWATGLILCFSAQVWAVDSYYTLDYDVDPVQDFVRPGQVKRDPPYRMPAGQTYYLSAEGGGDLLDGLMFAASYGMGLPTPGTTSWAWQTLNKANTTLVAGDRVLLQTGEYVGNIEPVNSGITGKPIQYIGWMAGAYIDGDIILNGKKNIIIRGLYLRNGSKIRISNSTTVSIEECTIADGQIIIENSINVRIDENVMYATGLAVPNKPAVVLTKSWGCTLINNKFHNYSSGFSSNTVINNLNNIATNLTDHPNFTPNASGGKDYYIIQGNGDDSNDGSSPFTPFKTLAKISSIGLTAGDRVFVGTGIYNESLPIPSTGTKGKQIEYIAFQPGVVIVVPAGLDGISAKNQSYITVDGFEWRTADYRKHFSLLFKVSDGIIVRNNLLYEGSISILYGSTNFLVEGNRITRPWNLKLPNSMGSGISLTNSYGPGIIRHNVSVFHDNEGAYVGKGDGNYPPKTEYYLQDVVVEGNFFGFNEEHGMLIAFAKNLIFRKNVFAYAPNGSPYALFDLNSCKFYNNTFYNAMPIFQPDMFAVGLISLHRNNDFRSNIFRSTIPDRSYRTRIKWETYMNLEVGNGEREFVMNYNLYSPFGVGAFGYTGGKPQRSGFQYVSFATLADWQNYVQNAVSYGFSKNYTDDLYSKVATIADQYLVPWNYKRIELELDKVIGFADPKTFDFRIKYYSPVVNSGDPNAPKALNRVDMGAFEYVK